MVVDVLDNLFHSCFDKSAELFVANGSSVSECDGRHSFDGFLEGGAIFQFEFFSFVIFNLERHDVFVDVGSAEGNDGEMSEDVVFENSNRSGFGAHIDENAAGTSFSF